MCSISCCTSCFVLVNLKETNIVYRHILGDEYILLGGFTFDNLNKTALDIVNTVQYNVQENIWHCKNGKRLPRSTKYLHFIIFNIKFFLKKFQEFSGKSGRTPESTLTCNFICNLIPNLNCIPLFMLFFFSLFLKFFCNLIKKL